MLLYDLSEATLNQLIFFFQQKQTESMKECSETCDTKQCKKLQKEITIFNNLAMNLMKLRELKKPT